ncbi:hypothetical protein K490DRAFT_45383 [Saccharata proteae CBS 121410]|uniref:Amino acid transporter transmembrane domain-containing protein n=1 Tax=Saccharata proteae CBS 121410 TaxID=1314787 RepID=A0A9P4HTY8_9PEZI|nr:hypothetical protein K490DRAFT_45383 [Saccharata proteae CBS 121410]
MPHSDARDHEESAGLLADHHDDDVELSFEPLAPVSSSSTSNPRDAPHQYHDYTQQTSTSAAQNQHPLSAPLTDSPPPLSGISPSTTPIPTLAGLGITQTATSSPYSSTPDQVGSPAPDAPPRKPGFPPRRQSSFAQHRPDGTPRTPNRVRFDDSAQLIPLESLDSRSSTSNGNGSVRQNGHAYAPDDDGEEERQRLPLLTGIEAPSVTMATEGEEGDDPEGLLESSRVKSGLKSAFMNMANSIIGAGIIGQPYAFKQAGLVTGIFLLVALTVTVDWTIRLIVINSKLSGANSFQATVQHCFGHTGLIAISVAQWAFAFGGMVAFCIIVGDTIPQVLAAIFPSLPRMHFLWLLTDRRAVIVLFILGVSYPLSLYRDIAKLAKASTLALISMLVIIVTVITQGFRVPPDMRGQLRGSLIINDGVFQAIGVISFAFVCHHNSLLIYGSLRKPTLDRFARVTHFSTTVSMLACLLMAVSGYLTFGDLTQGNVLNNFPSDNIVVNIARLCFGLNMLSTLPLEAFVCREVMETYWFAGESWNANRHLVLTTGLVCAATAASLLTCDLGAVFELIGATSACALAYILPPLCYLKLSKKEDGRKERWAARICVVFGCTVLVISLVQAVMKIMRSKYLLASCILPFMISIYGIH